MSASSNSVCIYILVMNTYNLRRLFISKVIKVADVEKNIVGLGACWHVKRSTQMSMLETCWCSEMGVLASLTSVSISIPRFWYRVRIICDNKRI